MPFSPQGAVPDRQCPTVVAMTNDMSSLIQANDTTRIARAGFPHHRCHCSCHAVICRRNPATAPRWRSGCG